jgi:hypothetical protein
MAGSNVTVNTTWTQIATNAQDFFLSVPFVTPLLIEVFTTEADEPPDEAIIGHPVYPNAYGGMNRTLILSGYVWARCKQGPVSLALSLSDL